MSVKKGVFSRRIILSALMIFTTMSAVFQADFANAAQITARSVTLGSATPSASTTYNFAFTVPTTGTPIKSVSFMACTTASGTCSSVAGFTNTSTLSQPTGMGAAAGWTANTATAGSIRIVNASNATNPSGNQTANFSAVANPSTANQAFYIRITTYSDAAWSTAIDTGTVAASTSTPIVLSGTMPESLIFCTGATISTTVGIPDCATATSGAVSFNQLFSPTDTATATSQMAASTNAATGYVITVNGVTLTSGGNTIPAMTTLATGVRGTGQFGLNLKLNTTATSTVAVGAEVALAPNGTSLRGQAFTGYNTVDSFKFVTGDTIAKSDNTVAGPTNAQIFTSSYVVNVAGNQASGTYTSTLTYICTATF
jgi:hypothetical protein